MRPEGVLITGGAGFVGSSLALRLKRQHPELRVIALDNLKRRGSELNIPRLQGSGVEFVHGDIRNAEDLAISGKVDLLLECSAEPSVLAGYGSSPHYLLQTNLTGTLNLLEYCRAHGIRMLFLSTSRVYPIAALNSIRIEETETRYEIAELQELPGISRRGISEDFPLTGPRSLYGATKLASEMFIEEYVYAYSVETIVNRCGVIAGPWQMGKIDQGVVVLWVARHVFGQPLSYIGFGGTGKQVRDVLHIDDLCDLVDHQIANFGSLKGKVFTVGGGREVSFSLLELTTLCETITGSRVPFSRVAQNRPADVPIYLSDNTRITEATSWWPRRNAERLIRDICDWICSNREQLARVLAA